MSQRLAPVLSSFLAVWALLSCDSNSVMEKALFGDLSAWREATPAPETLSPYLELARAVLTHQKRPPRQEPLPASSVFLLAHEKGKQDRAAKGMGDSLEEAVVRAAEALRATGPFDPSLRLQLDVVISAQRVKLKEVKKLEPATLGLVGYLRANRDGKVGYVLPSEMISLELVATDKGVKLKSKALERQIASRAHEKIEVTKRWTAWRFETVSVVESNPPGRALPLSRGMVVRTAPPTAEELTSAVRSGADYLLRVLDESGRYTYNYWAAQEDQGKSYNMLRHCGTTYSLLEAYEAFGDARYLAAAERALGYAKKRLRPRPEWLPLRQGLPEFRHLVDEEKGELSKTGGAGLALLAFAKHSQVTGSKENREIMRQLASFLMHQQEENGHFLSYFQYQQEVPVTQKEVLYYPGEAMLSLLRLNALEPNPLYLKTVRLGADYLIDVRDANLTEEKLEHDHWLSMALHELYKLTLEAKYAEHAFKISRAIARKQKNASDAPAPDFVGSFYRLPNSTPASVRLEAYAAVIALARFMGRQEDTLMESALEVAGFVKSQQFDAQNAFFLPEPEKAIGGVRESIACNNIRIDYVQHAMSGMLGFSRLLKDPSYGKPQGASERGALPAGAGEKRAP